MFVARVCVRNASVSKPIAGFVAQQRRRVSVARETILQTETPTAERLAATNLWYYGRKPLSKDKKKVKGDKHRVNIADEKLCDDVINYIRPTLDRHAGCDIVDLFPGAGLWSRKLHDVLQPRSHILLEPDEDLYAPFLEPLASRPNVTLVRKSGIVWSELNEVLTKEYLPHQIERDPRTKTPQRNDTLLVTANLSFFPKRKYESFANVTQLLLYQFINSIRSGTLFQKYGLVRMLIWVREEEKSAVMPRTIQRRKRLSIDAEMNTEYVAELAGADHAKGQDGAPGRFARDHVIDLESIRAVLARMKASGTVIPPGRETSLVREFTALGKSRQAAVRAGSQPAYFDRPYRAELEQLEADFESGRLSKADQQKHRRLTDLRYKVNWELKRHRAIHEMLSDTSATPADWAEKIKRLDKYLRIEFMLTRDNLHVFRQEPPVLTWDRRPVEPLVIRDTEFFPNVPCALLDIQPKATHPLLREMGPGTNRAGDMFAVILSSLMRSSIDPLGKVLESIYPGAKEGVLPNCPSLGGDMLPPGYAEWDARSLNERQFAEILEAWMEWPFRPGFSELIGRESEDSDLAGDDESGAVQTGDF
ncbi:rRNA adenine N(6)-methyltransferase [Coniochaeta hoffmannii]|uniref:rRNA adenine N(6)-methyltransferase n=1 Tax=Coniochaeta hoffmannii TaxID=91930 RepID=A0AA38VMB9_9PEZI|nr:rRNA adenine N(6)-methyltransferase [Coniochaeta hoffmannii]